MYKNIKSMTSVYGPFIRNEILSERTSFDY